MTAEEVTGEKLPTGHGRQAAKFGVVGILATMTDFAIYAGLVAAGFAPLLANGVAFVCANIQGYILNGVFTFRHHGGGGLSFSGYLRFLSGYLISFFIASLIIWLLSDVAGPLGAKIIATAVAAVMNYFISARFVFRQRAEP